MSLWATELIVTISYNRLKHSMSEAATLTFSTPMMVVVRAELYCVQIMMEYMRMKPMTQDKPKCAINRGLLHPSNAAACQHKIAFNKTVQGQCATTCTNLIHDAL